MLHRANRTFASEFGVTRTGRIASGISESFQSLSTLWSGSVPLAASAVLEDVSIENLGDTTLYLVSLPPEIATPTDADRVSLAAGQTKAFERIIAGKFYVKSDDIDGDNQFEIKGEPA